MAAPLSSSRPLWHRRQSSTVRQVKTLEAQRREHEKAANSIRRNEMKMRKTLASVTSLPAVAQS